MFPLIKKLFSVLNINQKKQLFYLQFLVIISAIFELGIVLIFGPFVAAIGNFKSLHEIPFFVQISSLIGVKSSVDFLLFSSSLILFLILISSILSIITIRKLSFFASGVGAEFGDRLYLYYMHKDYLYHSSRNSAEIIKGIATEVNRVTDNILQPLVQINARITTVILLSSFVFIYNPFVAITGVVLITTTYLLMFRVVKNKLLHNGIIISENSRIRFKLLNEGLNAIKEIQILGREDFFVKKFELSGKEFAKGYGSSNSLYNIPRYIIEFILFVSIILLVVFFTIKDGEGTSSFLSIITVFGIASLKLLPSFQQIYSGFAQIRSNLSAFDSIFNDLIDELNKPNCVSYDVSHKLSGDIVLDKVYFKYQGSDKYTLKNISLKIPFKSKIGIVGPSGSGKSTLIDIIMGSILTSNGEVTVGGEKVESNLLSRWRNNIGYVSQTPIIIDGTIADNIALGVNYSDIDFEKIKLSARIAHLDNWVDGLSESYQTRVGERGMQISGGQRQRLAIARAFYHNVEYLFFDEATSSLDTITERKIMKTIDEISDVKTVIMVAHRLNTVKKCDWIYVISEGELKAQGTYEYLVNNDSDFNKMAGID